MKEDLELEILEVISREEGDESEMFTLRPEEFGKCPVCARTIFGLILHEDGFWRCPKCHSRAVERLLAEVIASDNDGFPPEIGMAWVGLYLVVNRNDSPLLDRSGFWVKSDKPYWTWMDIAVQTLGDVFPLAVDWYSARYPGLGGRIYFKRWEIEEIGDLTEIDPTTRLDFEMIQEIVKSQSSLEGVDFSKAFVDF
jgi:hypothetical protein